MCQDIAIVMLGTTIFQQREEIATLKAKIVDRETGTANLLLALKRLVEPHRRTYIKFSDGQAALAAIEQAERMEAGK